MEALTLALSSYLITIVFALIIAGILALTARLVRRLRTDPIPATPPPAAPLPQEAARLAVAIAAAKSQAK